MTRNRRLAGATLALVLAGCADPTGIELAAQGQGLGIARLPFDPSIFYEPARGGDPLDVRAPLYDVSMVVFTDDTANTSTPIYKQAGGPSDPNFHRWAHADKVRASLQVIVEQNGTLKPAIDPTTCIIGEKIDGGDLGPLIYTREGGAYATCMAAPDKPDVVGKPLELIHPVEVGANDRAAIYARLEVLNSGAVVGPASDPNGGVWGGMKQMGGTFVKLGAVGAMVPGAQPLGGFTAGIGGFINTVAEIGHAIWGTAAHGPEEVCRVTETLVPGFGGDQPASDQGAMLLRVPLSGRELWERTRDGDAAMYYTLDWRAFEQTRLCNRPKTRVLLRVRRVVHNGPAGAPLIHSGGIAVAPQPDRIEAFSLDGNRQVVHDQRADRLWSSAEPLPASRFAQGFGGIFGGGFDYDLLQPGARLTAISKAPGELDTFAVSFWGDVVANWRNARYDGNRWHTWNDVSSGNLFPSGAPLAVVSRDPNHVDVFAVGRDGAIWTVGWDLWRGWQPARAISPAGVVPPWDGQRGGGIAAVARTNKHLDVFVVGHSTKLATAYFYEGVGWGFGDWLSPNLSWANPGTPVAAVSRNPQRLDVFFIDTSNRLQTLNWNGTWATGLELVTADAAPHGEIAVVARKVDTTGHPMSDNDHMDVFTVAPDGRIVHAPWRYGDDNYRWNAARAQKLAVSAAPGAPIGAVAVHGGTIQVVARRADGSLAKTWYEDVERGQLYWQSAP
jgi:hypothetical protein